MRISHLVVPLALLCLVQVSVGRPSPKEVVAVRDTASPAQAGPAAQPGAAPEVLEDTTNISQRSETLPPPARKEVVVDTKPASNKDSAQPEEKASPPTKTTSPPIQVREATIETPKIQARQDDNVDVVTITTIEPAPTDNPEDQQPDVVVIETTVPPPASTSKAAENKDSGGTDNTTKTVIITVVVVVVVVIAVAVGILLFRKYKLRNRRQERMKEALPQNFFSRTQESDAMFLRQLND
ncbi:hypothetical protein H4R33_003381 [Dimargaris cristalligena]|nr:hypothetical protein H4R33_003381 [Dimargaris cristalligena]